MTSATEDQTDALQGNTLESVLIALQKSISRVNEQSSKVPESQPRALIIGDLDFEISLKCDPNKDKLAVTNSGGISITLKGRINTDMEITSEGAG